MANHVHNWEEIAKNEGYHLLEIVGQNLRVKDSEGFIFSLNKWGFLKTRKNPRSCETPTEYFLHQIKNHPNFNKLDFSKVEFTRRFDYTTVKCKVDGHGDFNIQFSNLYGGRGCPKCGRISTGMANRSNIDEFTERANTVHQGLYDYSLAEYSTNNEKINILCKEHGTFAQIPQKHLDGQGCPSCAHLSRGFSRGSFRRASERHDEGNAIFYMLECFNENENFYKIGITSISIEERYRKKNSLPYFYKVTLSAESQSDEIFDFERKILREFKPYTHKPIIDFGGRTECFRHEIGAELIKFIRKEPILFVPISQKTFKPR